MAKLLSETNEHCIRRGTHFEGVMCNSLRHMASDFGLSYGTLQHMVVDVLQYQNGENDGLFIFLQRYAV
jgi:hypothetical protein